MVIFLERGEVESVNDAEYLENTIKRMVEELKTKNCLSQDFCFLTKAERDKALDNFIDDFIKMEVPRDHHRKGVVV